MAHIDARFGRVCERQRRLTEATAEPVERSALPHALNSVIVGLFTLVGWKQYGRRWLFTLLLIIHIILKNGDELLLCRLLRSVSAESESVVVDAADPGEGLGIDWPVVSLE